MFFLSLKCFELDEETLESREVVDVDIAYDEFPEKHYVPEEVRYDYVIIRDVIYQTRATVFHWDIQTPRRELKI